MANWNSRLRFARVQQGLTLELIAHQTGITLFALQDMEAGSSSPNLEELCNLSQALGVSVSFILGEIPEPKAVPAASPQSPRCQLPIGFLFGHACPGEELAEVPQGLRSSP